MQPIQYQLPRLDYSYHDLAPHISAAIMELHYAKHHQSYVDKLNAALHDTPALASQPLEMLLSRSDLPATIRNNGGGHYNHSQFWHWMSPHGGGQPRGVLAGAIQEKYGSFQAFVDAFSLAATTVFGSGWVWLTDTLDVVTTANQDTTMMSGYGEPLLGLDVWEHAYYLDYKNVRSDYIRQWWNVVNWDLVCADYEARQAQK